MRILYGVLTVLWYLNNCGLAGTIAFITLFAYTCNATGDAFTCAVGVEVFWQAWLPYAFGFLIMVPKSLIEDHVLKEKK